MEHSWETAEKAVKDKTVDQCPLCGKYLREKEYIKGKVEKIRFSSVNGIKPIGYNGSDIGFNELWIHVGGLTVADVWNVKVGDEIEIDIRGPYERKTV